MHLNYAATAKSSADASSIVDEALLLTLELFQLADVETISKRYAERCESLPDSPTDPWSTSKFGAQWTADACQQLRDMGFQEKWIAVLGDELDRWSPGLVPTSTLTHSIQQLATKCSADATATTQTLLDRGPSGTSAIPKLRRFSNAVCGLTIVLAALNKLDQPAASEKPSDADHWFATRALASFGAQLIVDHQPQADRETADPAPTNPPTTS